MPYNKLILSALFLILINGISFSQINAGVTSTGNSGTGSNINVTYHRCNWTADPNDATKTLTGSVTTYFKTIVANVASISFDFNNNSFNNASLNVLYHGGNCTFSFPTTGNVDILNITLPATIATLGTLDSITINYSGIPPAANGNEEGYQRKQDAVSNNYIYTLSESYEDRDWWPCKADMQDKIDSIDINVTVPSAFWVAANGAMVDSSINGTNRTFKFKHRYPIASYLVAIGIAKYKRYNLGNLPVSSGSVPFVLNLFPGKTTPVENNILSIMNMHKLVFATFNNLFGDYPYAKEKHGFYEFGFSGGMEHQTFSGIGSGSLQDDLVLAHELGHQWFGDKVTFATWNHLWLAEGFATYSESLAAEFVPSMGLNPDNLLYSNKFSARNITSNSVYINSITNSNAVWTSSNVSAVYDRGCMVVSMLRALLGDNKFFTACKNYLSDTAISFKSATSNDLQRNMENQFGESMSGFFTEWVTKKGVPNYTVEWGNVGNKLNLKLTQSVASAGTSGTASTFFPMPVIIKVSNAANTMDTTIVIYHKSANVLMYSGNGVGSTVNSNIISYNLSFTPASISFDPANKTMANATVTYSSLLPIAKIDLIATQQKEVNVLTASVTNNNVRDEVMLQKSNNNIDFSDVGNMNFQLQQNGNNLYQLKDYSVNNATVYYRAKTNINGLVAYSSVIAVSTNAEKKGIALQPNPAKDCVNVYFDNTLNKNILIKLLNIDGKILQTQKTTTNYFQLNTSKYTAGSYLIELFSDDKLIGNSKLVLTK